MGGLTEWLKGVLSLQEKKKAVPGSQTGSITVQQTGPRRLSLTVTGIISRQEIIAVQQRILALGSGGRLRGLIRAEEFTGFAPGAAGGMAEIERMHAVDEVVERIAVVADRVKHEDLNLFLCGWAREAQLKFFALGELEKAKAWLES